MGQPITRAVLADALDAAIGAAEASPAAERAGRAKAVLLNHPAIAPAITPIPRYKSEVLQGVAGVGAAQLLNAFGVTQSQAANTQAAARVATTVAVAGNYSGARTGTFSGARTGDAVSVYHDADLIGTGTATTAVLPTSVTVGRA